MDGSRQHRGVARRMGLVAGAVVAAAGVLATPGVGHAQERSMTISSRGFGAGSGDGMIAKRSVDQYVQMLGLNQEQKDSTMAVYDGYAAAYRQARKEQQDAMSELRRSAEDSGDNGVFMEKMPGIQDAFVGKTKGLEKQFFADVKSLLSGAEQEGRWPRVERSRRREVSLRGATVPGSGVDLTALALGTALTPEQRAALATPMEEYESELDRVIQAEPKVEGLEFKPGQPMQFDEERLAKMEKSMQDAREHALKLKDVNQRHAVKLEGLLPEDKRAAFRDEVKKATYPQVYRTPRVVREIDAALTLSDLSADQKSQLQSMKDSYVRDAKPLNEAWASAVDAAAKTGETGSPMRIGAGTVSIGEEKSELAAARKARRELDDKARSTFKGVLRPEQAERMPKIEDDEGGGGEGAGGARMMIMTRDR